MSFSAGVSNQTKICPNQQGHFQNLLLAQPSPGRSVDIDLRVTASVGRITVAAVEISFQDDRYRFKGKWGNFNVTGEYWADEANSAKDTGSVFIVEE